MLTNVNEIEALPRSKPLDGVLLLQAVECRQDDNPSNQARGGAIADAPDSGNAKSGRFTA